MATKKVKVRELDMSKIDGFDITDTGIIQAALKKDRLSGKAVLFSGLDGDRLDFLLKYGTLYPKSDYIFASKAPDKDDDCLPDREQTTTPLSCADVWDTPMIAIYDMSRFEQMTQRTQFRFLDPEHTIDALLAAYILRY